MSATERHYKIDSLLRSRGYVSFQGLQDELEVSRATLKRDIAFMRDRLHAPIVFDRDAGGYRFDSVGGKDGPKYELPGLWFNPQETLALLTMYQLLESLNPTLLGAHVKPLLSRLTNLLTAGDKTVEEVRRRIRLVAFAARKFDPKHFEMAAAAVLQRKRVFLIHWNRGRNEVVQRQVSPQRLVYYRNNWYMDGYCHLRKELRSFSLDAMKDLALQAEKAIDVPEKELDEILKSGYGIFSGKKVQWATLKFSPTISRWVSMETWHDKQRSRMEKDGSYILEVPYSHERELVMDVLKFGADCDVVAPASLRSLIREQHRLAARA